MPKLFLGVNDVPYSGPAEKAPSARRHRGPVKVRSAKSVTTGQVATWLENRYHIMEVFFELNADKIAGSLEAGLVDGLESMLAGAPSSLNPFTAPMSQIEKDFKHAISARFMDGMGIRGVPTKASLGGSSARFKDLTKQRAARPSFRDTGTYQTNFRAWIE